MVGPELPARNDLVRHPALVALSPDHHPALGELERAIDAHRRPRGGAASCVL